MKSGSVIDKSPITTPAEFSANDVELIWIEPTKRVNSCVNVSPAASVDVIDKVIVDSVA